MKTLIFTLVFTFQALAAGSNPNEVRLTDQEISQKLVSVAKDIENQQILANQPDLQKCRDDFQAQYNPSSPNPALVTALESCISNKIRPADAERISNSLGLETYSLVPTKTVNNVTEYLSKNLYRQLTGVDLNQSRENRIRAEMFKNKKQIA